MGNNNSRQDKKVNVVPENNVDYVREFYTIDSDNQFRKVQDDIYSTANEMYNSLWDESEQQYMDIFSDPSRGIQLPYLANRNAFGSETKPELEWLSSENPKYIEFIYCKGSIDGLTNDKTEKYRVNQNVPDHACGKNCHCIRQFIEITGN